MGQDLRAFWGQIQSGVEVAVASTSSAELLGTRDGFLRYLRRPWDQTLPIVIVPHDLEMTSTGLAASDEETVEFARQRVERLREEVGETYNFFVAVEGGIHALEVASEPHYFVRSWAVVAGPLGEAWGSSGSIEIPGRLVQGLDGPQVPHAVPGTRRSGGMISSLTGGKETRRQALETAVFHALSTLFYGVLDRPPSGPKRP